MIFPITCTRERERERKRKKKLKFLKKRVFQVSERERIFYHIDDVGQHQGSLAIVTVTRLQIYKKKIG
jgi:hypothetical protein